IALAHEDLVRLLKLAAALQQLRMLYQGSGDVPAGDRLPGLDLSDGLWLQPAAIGGQQRPVHGGAPPRTEREKDRIGATEIRTGVLHDAPERFEGHAPRCEHGSDAAVERETTKGE